MWITFLSKFCRLQLLYYSTNQPSNLCIADYDAQGYFLNQAFEWKTSASRCPHWMEYSCANSPFIMPPTICVPIGCRPHYSTMRHNELAGNREVVTTSISLNIRWRMSHVNGEYVWGRKKWEATTCFLFFICMCMCVSEFTGSCSSQQEFGSVGNRPHEKKCQIHTVTGTYRHKHMDTPLLCCSVYLTCKLLWAEIAFSLYGTWLQNL